VIDSWPPALLSTVVRPAVSVSVPPAPLSPLPTPTAMAPPAPPVAAADPIDTEPLVPELDVPELKTSRPLAPLTPAFTDRIANAPDELN
jgi:hypothetical protein